VQFPANDAAQIENYLAAVRASRLGGRRRGNHAKPIWKTCFLDVMGAALMTGWQAAVFTKRCCAFGRSALPNRGRTGADRAAVHADFWPCAGRPRHGVRQRQLHRVLGAWLGDDERAAKRVCQQFIVDGA
jgi:hypothetical protein